MTDRPRRVTVYRSEALDRALDGRWTRDGVYGLSGLLAAVAERYAMIVRHELVEHVRLSTAEWSLVCDALNGVWMQDAVGAGHIRLEIADAVRGDDLAAKWEVDGVDLLRRLDELEAPAVLAIVDVVERFWTWSGQHPHGPLADFLRSIGIEAV